MGSGISLDNGTIAGINATSSSYTFNVQANAATNPFQIASSSGASYFTVLSNGSTTISSLVAGLVKSTAGGSLYVGPDSVATSTNTVNVGVTDDTTTSATMYPLWVTASSGNLPTKVSSSKMTWNPGALGGTMAIPNLQIKTNGGLRLQDAGGTFYQQILPNETNTATRVLNLKLNDGDRNFTLGGDLNIATGTVTLSGSSTGAIGIGTTTVFALPATLSIYGTSSRPTLDLFNVASSTGTSLFKIDSFGSTTITNIATGIVGSISGALYAKGTTGTGNVVQATSPTFTTPILGVASGTALTLTDNLYVGGNITATAQPANLVAIGPTINYLLSASTTAGNLVFLNSQNGRWSDTNANSTTTASSTGMLGVALTTGASGTVINVALAGSIITNTGWSFSSSTTMFVGTTTNGTITNNEPNAVGNVDRVVGYMVGPSTLWFNPSDEWLERK